MAAHAVAAGERGVHKTLSAATADTVTFAVDCNRVEVLNRDGAAAIYFTTDGTTPVVEANNTFVLPAAIGSVEVEPDASGVTVIKLISAGTPTYSVMRTA